MPSYSFDVEHAERWGVSEAIFLHNLIHWLRKNKAEGRNVQPGTDGVIRVWSYSTMEAVARLYPFWKTHQVRYAIDSLKKQGVIVTDKLSKVKFDRTLWFAVVDEELLALADLPPVPDPEQKAASDPFEKFNKSKRGKEKGSVENPQMPSEDPQMHLRKSANGSDDNRSSYIGSDSNPNSNAAYIQPTEKTLNVGGQGLDISNSLDTPTFEAVRAVIDRFNDPKSARRFTQLRQICKENNRTGAWMEALRSTEKRMRRTDEPLRSPGAYFCAALVRQLEDVGIVVPAGSAEERAEIGGLIAASLAAGGD